MKATIAVGTDLACSVPVKALAAVAHARAGTVDRTVVTRLVLGGLPGTVLGLALCAAVRAHVGAAEFEAVVRRLIGAAILGAAGFAIVSHAFGSRRARRAPSAPPAPWATTGIGCIVGLLVAMTSIGAGAITLPLLMLALPAYALRALIGSEIAFAALIVPVAALGHTMSADVDWRIVANLTLGGVPGAYLGTWLCARLGDTVLRPAVIGLLVYSGVRLL